MPRYSCYGLAIGTTSAFPALGPDLDSHPGVADPGEPAVTIVEVASLAAPPARAAAVAPDIWLAPDYLRLRVPDKVELEVDGGDTIRFSHPPGAGAVARLYVLGTGLGTLLRHRGHLVLHGNAVGMHDGSCIVAVGHSGAGKSTLAAEFLARGHPVLADDVVPIDDAGHALPGVPRIKLWQDAVDRYDLATDRLVPVASHPGKFELRLADPPSRSAPVSAVYVLETAPARSVELTPYAGASAFTPLHEHTYRGMLIHDPASQAIRLDQCGRLTRTARVVRLARPEGVDSVGASADAIMADVRDRPALATPTRTRRPT